MPQRLAGQLVDGGDPVSDEPVFVVDTGPDDESNWSIVATDRSAADGSWSVTVPNADAERYHAVAQFEKSGTLKNALSKPFLTSQPFAQPGLVTVGFDVLPPSTIGSVVPDSGGTHQWNTDEAEGTTLTDAIGELDGTINGATWTSGEGAGDVYLSYDGTDDYTDLGADSRTELTHFTEDGEGTVFAWVNPDFSSDFRSILSSGASDDDVGILFRAIDSNEYQFTLITDGTSASVSGGNLESGWIPVAATADGSTARLFVGESMTEVGSDTITDSTTNDFTANVNIGRTTEQDTHYWDGGIDIVWTDNQARTQSFLQSFVDDSKQFYE